MLKICPLCGREHEVDKNGTIATWVVTYGDESSGSFIHKEDAEAEYTSIMQNLKVAMMWHRKKHLLKLEQGERVSWSEMFETGVWMA